MSHFLEASSTTTPTTTMKRSFDDSDDEGSAFDDPRSGSPSQSCGEQSNRKKRRGIIEKRRRDRINSSLMELRRLVPAAFEKQGSAKLEKAEILQMTVDHLRQLSAKGLDPYNGLDAQSIALDYRCVGFRECASEVARYLVSSEGLDIQDPLRLRLMSHLQWYSAQKDATTRASEMQQRLSTAMGAAAAATGAAFGSTASSFSQPAVHPAAAAAAAAGSSLHYGQSHALSAAMAAATTAYSPADYLQHSTASPMSAAYGSLGAGTSLGAASSTVPSGTMLPSGGGAAHSPAPPAPTSSNMSASSSNSSGVSHPGSSPQISSASPLTQTHPQVPANAAASPANLGSHTQYATALAPHHAPAALAPPHHAHHAHLNSFGAYPGYPAPNGTPGAPGQMPSSSSKPYRPWGAELAY